ncbi:MAG: hypothetical protein CVU39_21910 [Chloroflexi bacterium HGW-Chloroflexi-10]|nr:MAG: hypothetical protein CVU39_21910 [Chloroflexi bacterium HGW-Chloroflexi-10]
MLKPKLLNIQLDDQNHLVLPPEILQKYGLSSGSVVRLQQTDTGFTLSRSTASLAKVYVEATNICNLDCSTCMRNVWDEPLGKMDESTFARVLLGIQSFSPPPTVFFGGFGEPLAHPNLLEMIAAVRILGAEVELITNGILLTKPVINRLIELKVNRIWVSIDGATPASYADVRLGDALPQVIENLTRLKDIKHNSDQNLPLLGVAFVAMKRNLNDLPNVIRLGKSLGADQFSISNLLPHTAEMQEEILYMRSMYDIELQPSRWSPEIYLPRIDLNHTIIGHLAEIMKAKNMLNIGRQPLNMGVNSCPFLEKGSISIRWDGAISPCLPLLHTHQSYLAENLRTTHAYAVGSINDHSLKDLWNNPQYIQLRENLQAFDFSPCTFCNSCDMAESNLEDCFGNSHPTCGGCLWAQGFIQCP